MERLINKIMETLKDNNIVGSDIYYLQSLDVKKDKRNSIFLEIILETENE